ncbi:ABC transporter substrate-binding protein [Evansella sp. AB-rgal1]|uniref:ABC transporter substrate-binding protein n=1 Tax=Evansella sp. AB-rgal1 TaxID=3242696 RepID=UPI00359DBF27
MIKRKKIIVFCISTLLFFIYGCVVKEENNSYHEDESIIDSTLEENVDHNSSPDDIILTMWSYYSDGWDNIIEQFESIHDGITIELETISYGNYPQEYFKSFVEGNTPDIVVIDSPHIGDFKAVEGLENLLYEPYEARIYENDFSESLWDTGKSLDGNQLIGIPYVTAPFVAFYRADIMEQYGYPADPEKLAVFMEDPANWLEMVSELAKDNIWMVQWPMEVLRIYESGTGMFDNSLNFQRNNESFLEAIDLAQTIHKNSLYSSKDIWSPVGQEAIKNDQYAMLYLGTWGTGLLNEWVPEQAGKWRMTRLPFNVYGWMNSSILSIPEASENKDLAWEFIKFSSFELPMEGFQSMTMGYLPSRNNPKIIDYESEFLGGQREQELIEKLMAQTKEHTLTPLDIRANEIWYEKMYGMLEWGYDADEILVSIEETLDMTLGQEREILLRHISQ